MIKQMLAAAILVAVVNTAHADGRTVAYLQGVAFAIAANCQKPSPYPKAMRQRWESDKATRWTSRAARFNFMKC